jgi:acetyl-CoA acetyltransferase
MIVKHYAPEAVGRYILSPLARLVARTVVGSDPVLMLDAPIPATKKVLGMANLTLADMDVIEINEAFASVVLAWEKEFKPDMAHVNPNGGAIAHGHQNSQMADLSILPHLLVIGV